MDEHYYILNEKKEIVTTDMETWAKWVAGDLRIVEKTNVGEASVSTVFLTLDHAYDGGPPVLFETMVFGGEHDQFQERYCTYDEAKSGHKETVKMVKGKE